MKTKFAKTLILGIALLSYGIGASADVTTLWLPAGVRSAYVSTNFFVPTNVVATVVSSNLGYGYLQVGFDTNSAFTNSAIFYASNPVVPVVVGPATIALWLGAAQGPEFCTIKTEPNIPTSPGMTPSTAVVIPADASGPVSIILESSVDLVNWTPALPGTYGTTTTNRFFRVRAQR